MVFAFSPFAGLLIISYFQSSVIVPDLSSQYPFSLDNILSHVAVLLSVF